MNGLHPCAVPGCLSLVEHHRLMCYTHWTRVPRDRQHAVYHTWTAIRHSAKPTAEDVKRYRAARTAAIQAAVSS